MPRFEIASSLVAAILVTISTTSSRIWASEPNHAMCLSMQTCPDGSIASSCGIPGVPRQCPNDSKLSDSKPKVHCQSILLCPNGSFASACGISGIPKTCNEDGVKNRDLPPVGASVAGATHFNLSGIRCEWGGFRQESNADDSGTQTSCSGPVTCRAFKAANYRLEFTAHCSGPCPANAIDCLHGDQLQASAVSCFAKQGLGLSRCPYAEQGRLPASSNTTSAQPGY